jgi:hypothetical protein
VAISLRVIIELPGGRPELGGYVLGEGFSVAEAGDVGVQAGKPAEGRGGLGTVGVEHAGHDLSVGSAGCRVACDQDMSGGKVERDAARGVPGNGDGDGAAADAELVTVVEFMIDPHWGRVRGW